MQSSNVDSFEFYSLFYDQNLKMNIYNNILDCKILICIGKVKKINN